MNWMADGLMIYRLFVIWNRRILIVALPITMLMTSVSLSIVELHRIIQPTARVSRHLAINFRLLYWSFSVSLNVLVTLLIVGRLLFVRHQISRAIQASQARVYTSVSAMLIESAALYSFLTIVFLIGYTRRSPLQFAIEAVELIQGVCPLMIILRVARGNAWSCDTYMLIARSIAFAPNPNDPSSGTDTSSTQRTDISTRYGFKSVLPSTQQDASVSEATISTFRAREGSIPNIEVSEEKR